MRSPRSGLVVAVSLVLFAVVAVPGQAHIPIGDVGPYDTPETVLDVPDPGLSQVAYRDMTDRGEFWMRFEAWAGFRLYTQLGVPVLDRLRDYTPELALVGPGVGSDRVPFELPEGTGALILTDPERREHFDEVFTGTQSWTWPTDLRPIRVTGTYYLVAFEREPTDGKLWVAIGLRERFGLGDILEYHDTLEFVREFHEVDDEPLPSLPRTLDYLSVGLNRFLTVVCDTLGHLFDIPVCDLVHDT